jgi:SCF-associated factor 1
VPNQPVVKHDGVRWQKMYRRMLTQSHVFAWGSNVNGRLGHSYAPPHTPQGRHPLGRRRFIHNAHCSFPTEMENTRHLGIIADMQCG